MATESIRGCGYRRVGGLYLCGGSISITCDRLPYPFDVCPVCNGYIKVTRCFIKINPFRLFGNHDYCTDRIRPCFMCDPKEALAFLMSVGKKFYTPASFLDEAQDLNISKRIPFIPKELKLGETAVYLSHPEACPTKETPVMQQVLAVVEEHETRQERMLDAEAVKKAPGIFSAFIPHRIEKLCWQRDYTPENIEKHRKRCIDLVPVPDGDVDHAP